MASDRDSGSDEDEFSEPDGLTELHQGIVNNDLTLLQQALESGVSPNEKFTAEMNPQHDGMTPLALAAALNKVEAVKLLLTYEADVNDTFASLKTTALMTSSFHGHSEIVRVLLKKGASVRAIDLQGSTALGYAFGGARTTEVIHQLLKAGVDVNQKNMLGMSSLLLVAGYGNDVLTKMILDAGADAKSTNDFGHSALHLTVVGKRSQIKKLMSGQTGSYGLNRRNIDVALKEWARLHSDTVRGHDNELELEKVGEFMMSIGSKLDEREHISDDDNEAMKRRVEAVWRHRQDKIQAEKEKKKSGVLDNFFSCGGKRGKQAKQAKHGSKSPMARPFVPLDNDPGKSVGSSDVDRNVNQISDSCSKILRMIIDHGCEIDWVEKTFGMTALDMAILLGDVESTAVLVAAGGDSNHLMKMFALTDLYEAIVQLDKKQVKEVLTFDSDVDVNQSFSQFNVTRRRGTGETDNLKSDGLTPLTVAAQMNESEILDIMKMLLKQGADINKVGPGGSCPLAEACRMGNLKMVQFLVSQGANIETSCPSYKDATPVTIAAMSGHRLVVEFLLAKEAKIDKPMSDGRSALIKAVDNGDWEMVEQIFNANLLDNFSDRNNFTHEMAERYQRPDRDFESLKRSITDEARRLAERDREQNSEKDKATRNSTSARPVAERQNRQKQMTLDDPVPPSQGRRNRAEQQRQRPEQQGQRPEQMSLDDPVPPSQGRTNDTEQQKQRPKQQKEVKPPSPEESSEDDEDKNEEQKKKQLKQQEQKHQPKHVQQQHQQQQQPKQQKHQQLPLQSPPVKPPPPPAESSSEEEDEAEEEVPPYRQQPQQKQQQQQQPKQEQQQPKQQQQQPKQQQQQPKQQQPKQQQQQLQKEQVSKPLPQEITSSDEEEEEEEKEARSRLQQKQQQPPASKTTAAAVAAAAAAPALAQKKQSSSEEDEEEEEEEEDEEDEEEEEEVKPTLPAQVQKQVNSQVPAVKPPGDQVLKVSQVPAVNHPGDQVLKIRQVQKQESSSEEEETEEEEESEEEEEEIKAPPQKAVAAASVLPSDKFDNRAKPAMPNNSAAQEKPARQDIAQTKPSSSASAIPTKGPAAAASVRSPVSPSGPPPPLPSAGPPSETPTESEEEDDDDDEDWDEDEDFEENHIDVASKEDELSSPSKDKVGTSQVTVKTAKSSSGVTTRTVVTKTVVTSNVTTRSEPFKGQAKIAKIEDSDDDDDDEDEEEEEEEDDDEEESDESHERPRHHSTETDI